ncbi:MAG TPA: 4-hydroxythreonine-4-phosphate dehydrogenase PdxA [Burkholderiaceae bacterium]|nr:4-hydroxythreonine-4-phosphate dehydrogenase PdxA [Burkholderiaceae bacterium]
MHAPIAITTGEPSGIGPEIVAMGLARLLSEGRDAREFVVLGHRATLMRAATLCGVQEIFERVAVHEVPVAAAPVFGQLNARNAAHVIAMLDAAIDGAREGHYSAIVTAPVHKGVINDAGIAFTGHTEYLAERCHVPRVVMMLVGGGMRVALATTHLPLRAVPDAITRDGLVETLDIIHRDLRTKFCIERPRVLVCGLNPHAGEGGHLGSEEIDVIEPALTIARARGLNVRGPMPADTLFQARLLNECDAVLAMYHDQGLPVLKHASFGRGVNITLGLPIVRTSVDHGTALDLAGTGKADCGSFIAAMELACSIVVPRSA